MLSLEQKTSYLVHFLTKKNNIYKVSSKVVNLNIIDQHHYYNSV